MTEDERLKQALEAELEDSYQEYLTLALKGETQDLMQTSPKFQKNMEKLVRETEKAASSDVTKEAAAEPDSRVVYIKPRSKNKLNLFVKVAVGVSAVACVAILCIAVALTQMGDLTKDRNQNEYAPPGEVAFIDPTAIYQASEAPRENELVPNSEAVAAETVEDIPEGTAIGGVPRGTEENGINGGPAAEPGLTEAVIPWTALNWEKAEAYAEKSWSEVHTTYKFKSITLRENEQTDQTLTIPRGGQKDEDPVAPSNAFRLALILPEIDQKLPSKILGGTIEDRLLNMILVSNTADEDKIRIVLDCWIADTGNPEEVKADKAELWVLYADQVYRLEYNLKDS